MTGLFGLVAGALRGVSYGIEPVSAVPEQCRVQSQPKERTVQRWDASFRQAMSCREDAAVTGQTEREIPEFERPWWLMPGSLRFLIMILVVALYTLPLLVAQEFALRTKLMSDRRIPRLWHRMTLKMLGVRVEVEGERVARRPLLIAANHVSWLDILILGSLDGVHFIAKAEMRHWPVLGTFARQQRSVFVERDRRRASPEQAREIAERLADGDPMVLFAEGTTGDGNGVLPFKSTLFSAAQLALATDKADEVVVQPVAIAYTRTGGLHLDRRERAELAWIGDTDLVPHLKTVLAARPIDVKVCFGKTIPFRAQGDRKAVARAAETEVRRMLVEALRGGKS